MIQRYTDHAANERTFLAWVRTAIAVMAFGFLVERFDLFLQIAGQTHGAPRAVADRSARRQHRRLDPDRRSAPAMMVLAIVRFRKTDD